MMRLAQKFDESPEAIQNNSATSAGTVPGIDLQEYLSILLRQKWVILATVTVIMAFAFVVVSFLTPRYTADVLVQINPRQTQVVDFEAVLSGLPTDAGTIQTEIQIIQSRKIAHRTVTRLQLSKDPEFNTALRPVGWFSSWRYAIAAWLTSLAAEREGDGLARQEDVKDESTGFIPELILKLSGVLRPSSKKVLSEEEQVRRENDRVINSFLRKLTVAPEGRSRIVRISFESENPKTAASAANTVADFYIVAQLEAKFEATKRATTWLGEHVDQLREEVRAKELIVEDFRANSGLLQGGRDATLTSEQVSELNAQHVTELTRLAEAEARLQQVNKLLGSPEDIESAIEVLESPIIRDLRREESRIVRQIAELSEEYGELYPTMINSRAELRDLRSKIGVEVDRIIQGLRNEVAVARARAATLVRSLESVKKQIAVLNQSEVQLRALERDATASRTLLENLMQRTKQTVSQETFQEADADIVSNAPVPGAPSSPRKGIILPLTFFAALMQGILLAFAIEKLDRGFRSMEQVEHFLGVSPLGLIPTVSKVTMVGKKPHDYVLENPEAPDPPSINEFIDKE